MFPLCVMLYIFHGNSWFYSRSITKFVKCSIAFILQRFSNVFSHAKEFVITYLILHKQNCIKLELYSRHFWFEMSKKKYLSKSNKSKLYSVKKLLRNKLTSHCQREILILCPCCDRYTIYESFILAFIYSVCINSWSCYYY